MEPEKQHSTNQLLSPRSWACARIGSVFILNQYRTDNETGIVKVWCVCVYVHPQGQCEDNLSWLSPPLLRTSRPAAASFPPSAQWPDRNKTIGHPVLFFIFLSCTVWSTIVSSIMRHGNLILQNGVHHWITNWFLISSLPLFYHGESISTAKGSPITLYKNIPTFIY